MWLGTGRLYGRRRVHSWWGRLVFGICLSLAITLRKCGRWDGNFRRWHGNFQWRRWHIPIRDMPGLCHGIWRRRSRIPGRVLLGLSHSIRQWWWEIPVRVMLGFSQRIRGRLLSRRRRRLPSWSPITIPLLPVPSTATFAWRTLGLAAARKTPDRGGIPGSSGIPRRLQCVILGASSSSWDLSIVMFCNSTRNPFLVPCCGNRTREERSSVRLTCTKHK